MKWSEARRKWRKIVIRVYLAVLGASAIFGFIVGVSPHGPMSDPIAILTLFILFPVFIISDSVLRSSIIWCPVRAVSLPLTEGFLIYVISGWHDPWTISQIVAMICGVGSFVVSGISYLMTSFRAE